MGKCRTVAGQAPEKGRAGAAGASARPFSGGVFIFVVSICHLGLGDSGWETGLELRPGMPVAAGPTQEDFLLFHPCDLYNELNMKKGILYMV